MTTFLLIIGGLIVVFIGLGLLSQKGEAPGLIEGKLKEPGSKPNVVCSEAGVQPERFVDPLNAALNDVADVIEQIGGTITSRSETYLSATFMSRIFKYVDDVEIRQDGDICHIRSGSRVGHSDMGANKKRVEQIRRILQSEGVANT
ncbi:DUF1499 domain-containing protein [Litorimonas sp. WD9-15]|uniref:DUF1499 domain-containing protein n=1 Tax=Litorimonas sp. WD9-15 TaxID=3418716 RepID=UPI003CFBF983